MITLFTDLISVMPLSNLAKISLPHRSTLVLQDFLCNYCFGPLRLIADQEKGLPTALEIEILASAITAREPCIQLHG